MARIEIQQGDITLTMKTQGPRKGPTLLFLHAAGESRSVWSPIFSRLRPQHWQLAAPDLGGDGGHAQDYLFDDFLSEAHQIIRGLKGRPLILVGSAVGGFMALMLTMQYPALIDGLVLLDAPSRPSMGAARTGRQNKGERLGQNADAAPNTGLLKDIFANPLPLARAAQSVSVPTLFLYGSHSEIVGEEELHGLRLDIPHVETVKIDAGHSIARDNPQAVADEIAAFVPTLIRETIH